MRKTERGEGPTGSQPLPRPRSRRRAPRPGALPGGTRRAIKPTGVNPRRQTKVYKPADPWIVERPVMVAQTPHPQMPVGPQHVPARASPDGEVGTGTRPSAAFLWGCRAGDSAPCPDPSAVPAARTYLSHGRARSPGDGVDPKQTQN